MHSHLRRITATYRTWTSDTIINKAFNVHLVKTEQSGSLMGQKKKPKGNLVTLAQQFSLPSASLQYREQLDLPSVSYLPVPLSCCNSMLELSSGASNCFQLPLTSIVTSIFNIYRNGLRAKMLFGWGKLDFTLRKDNGHPGAVIQRSGKASPQQGWG